jgi:predicted GIY-YIG superfamily endonuclease
MADYANGKIYKIVGDDGSTYYGSTTTSLKRRLGRHRYNKGTTAHQKIISQMDWNMILVENYPCESKKELLDREATYIRENPCVNREIPGRTGKEYYENNRKELLEIGKKYYEENCEVRKAYSKIRNTWIRSFGDPPSTNNLQRCDYMLFQ